MAITNITAVILAGGRGSRLEGKDKGLLEIDNKPLIQYVIEKLRPQLSDIIISANRNLNEYEKFNLPVYADTTDNYAGPLAGILTALKNINTEWLLVVPADCPFISDELTHRLYNSVSKEQKRIAIAGTDERLQPTFALVHHSLKDNLQTFLDQGDRKTQLWMQQQAHTIVDFSDQTDSFVNINTEAELKLAKQRLAANHNQ